MNAPRKSIYRVVLGRTDTHIAQVLSPSVDLRPK